MNDGRKIVAAIDPGRDKCGLAVVSDAGEVLLQRVIATEHLEEEAKAVVAAHGPACFLLGNGTTSKKAESRLRSAIPSLPVQVVDEYRTTELARKEYWKANPPSGWRRLLPTSMQVPPVPVDDFVAVLLAKRYLSAQKNEKN